MSDIPEELVCPFCKEGEFDAVGLKAHLSRGWCKKYNNVMTLEEERKQKQEKSEEELREERPISTGPIDAEDMGYNSWLNEDFTL